MKSPNNEEKRPIFCKRKIRPVAKRPEEEKHPEYRKENALTETMRSYAREHIHKLKIKK